METAPAKNTRFVAAKELSAASFQQQLYPRGCTGLRDPASTRDTKGAYRRHGIISSAA